MLRTTVKRKDFAFLSAFTFALCRAQHWGTQSHDHAALWFCKGNYPPPQAAPDPPETLFIFRKPAASHPPLSPPNPPHLFNHLLWQLSPSLAAPHLVDSTCCSAPSRWIPQGSAWCFTPFRPLLSTLPIPPCWISSYPLGLVQVLIPNFSGMSRLGISFSMCPHNVSCVLLSVGISHGICVCLTAPRRKGFIPFGLRKGFLIVTGAHCPKNIKSKLFITPVYQGSLWAFWLAFMPSFSCVYGNYILWNVYSNKNTGKHLLSPALCLSFLHILCIFVKFLLGAGTVLGHHSTPVPRQISSWTLYSTGATYAWNNSTTNGWVTLSLTTSQRL